MQFIDLHENVNVGIIGGGRGDGVLEILKVCGEKSELVGAEGEVEMIETEGGVTVKGVEGVIETEREVTKVWKM